MAEVKEIPQPIHNANAALQHLLLEDSTLAESLVSVLPAYAMKQARGGAVLTVEDLLTAARQGPDALRAPRLEMKQKQYDYKNIMARLRSESKDESDDEEVNAALIAAGKTGDLDRMSEVFELYKHHFNDTYKFAMALRGYFTARPDAEAIRHAVDVMHDRIKPQEFVPYSSSDDHTGTMEPVSKNLFIEHLCDFLQDDVENQLRFRDAYPDLIPLADILYKGNGVDKICRVLDHYKMQPGDILNTLLDQNHMLTNHFCKTIRDRYDYDLFSKKTVSSYEHRNYYDYLERCGEWQKTARRQPPERCEYQDPAVFRPVAFTCLQEWLTQEGYGGPDSHYYAFTASAVFGTPQRVLEYLDRWGKPGKQPLHDLIQHLALPKDCDAKELDLQAWADGILKCGPGMAKLVAFADKLPQPEKSDDGKTWSLAKTRIKVAQLAYRNAGKNSALAALCFEHLVPEDRFEKALAVAGKAPPEKNIPDIAIDGEAFGMPGAHFRRLAPGDVQGLMLGEIVNCCQSVGGHGDACAVHGHTSKNGGFYVIEDAQDKIIGEAWAWRGTKGELCLDSLESLGDRVHPTDWLELLQAFKKSLKDLAAQKKTDVTALTVGTGGRTPRGLSHSFTTAQKPARPKGYSGYRDSREQLLLWHL